MHVYDFYCFDSYGRIVRPVLDNLMEQIRFQENDFSFERLLCLRPQLWWSKSPPFCFTQTKHISAGNGSQLRGKRFGPGEKTALSHYPVSLSPRSVSRDMIAKD